jgi:hypothetical protein
MRLQYFDSIRGVVRDIFAVIRASVTFAVRGTCPAVVTAVKNCAAVLLRDLHKLEIAAQNIMCSCADCVFPRRYPKGWRVGVI